jgi:chromatin remodeling complex protein RSC6|mmetsp:Transcript_10696/g.49118  ORF Transcript_10696/g.49118 Transcript_10696/m.49118 type:complete len:291 (-) Transcript_10696:199-1071(-)
MAPKKAPVDAKGAGTKDASVIKRLHQILKTADLEKTTVKNIQKQLEGDLGVPMSDRKQFIRDEVEKFLKSNAGKKMGATKRKAEGEPKGKKSKEGKIGKDGKKKRGRGKGKDVVDPNKPKGPKGAYMCFVQIARPKINASNPGMKFADIAKTLGEQWKGMDATTRGGYEKMAEADKERYQREIAAYVPMSEAGLEQLRKEKAAKKSAGGLQKPYKCSSALTKFLGGDKTISRANLTSKMWSYFKEKNLMDPENKRWIIADKNLSDLLGVDRFQGFTVSKYLSPHLLPMEQ